MGSLTTIGLMPLYGFWRPITGSPASHRERGDGPRSDDSVLTSIVRRRSKEFVASGSEACSMSLIWLGRRPLPLAAAVLSHLPIAVAIYAVKISLVPRGHWDGMMCVVYVKMFGPELCSLFIVMQWGNVRFQGRRCLI